MQQLSTRASTEVSGHGWMVGPYATLRLSENVFWQGRTAWGQSSNTVSPFLTYDDRFDTDRWLASTSLLGRWNFGAWSFRPSASVAYIEDTSQSYADTFGVVIPSIKASLGQAKAGPEFSYRFELGDAVFMPRVGLQAIWNFAGDTSSVGSGPVGDDTAGPEGVRGRVELGVTATIKDGVGVDLSSSYDGVGANGYSAVTGRAAVRVPLN
jgi:outer membrane autotransporter protein